MFTKRELSPQTVAVVKDSACLITANDLTITKRMCEILFERHPSYRKIFGDIPEEQYMKVAEVISAYAVNIDKLHILEPALKVIAQAHVSKQVQSGHYKAVGMSLLQSIEETLEHLATPAFIDAWREAYIYISDILIELEKNIYEEMKSAQL